MRLKPLFKQYKMLDSKILVAKKEINERKRQLLPSMAQSPDVGGFSGNFTGSSTENTVLKFENDRILQYWRREQEQAEAEKEFVEQIIDSLKQPEQNYFKLRYIYGHTVAKVAEECNVTTQHLYNAYSKTFNVLEESYRYL